MAHELPEGRQIERHKSRGRQLVEGMIGGLAIHIVFAGYVQYDNYREYNPELSKAVETIAADELGDELDISCREIPKLLTAFGPNYTEIQGYVAPVFHVIPTERINLNEDFCEAIVESEQLGLTPMNDLTLFNGMFVIEHERQHTLGVLDEAEATCRALQALPAKYGKRGYEIAHIQAWQDPLGDWYRQIHPNYQSSECHVNGEMDLTPEQATFSDIWLPQK